MRFEAQRDLASASWQHGVLVAVARAAHLRALTSRSLVSVARRTAAAADAPLPEAPPPSRAVRDLAVTRRDHDQWPVWELRPPGAVPGRSVVYFHGGAYVAQISGFQWRWAAEVARRTRSRVVVPVYPLAPRGTAAPVVASAADLTESLGRPSGQGTVSVVGDSAGGGLALAVAQELVRRGGARPERLVLVSPWLDATVSDPESTVINDPILDANALREAGALWAGALSPADALVSPLFGTLKGLPRTFVVAGTLDILYPDTRRLRQRAAEEGVEMDFEIKPGLVHTWSLMPFLPETRASWPGLVRGLTGAPSDDRCPGARARR